ncbi:hypothetical protein Rsub_01465 [Raphidocelis subcapitata]|uniref:Uncharacterized protein n=1 Tax=Raphidocelis subcapitata TaxID=307507 RepID=A0A2V0NN55_9CHLO|nr:hypothetical protein Rsub_01465 [Raphidocelis subcapitata]|eukprot:GBF88966.1 hypothetical protein Rsub_01465 [Raphidocelis subcapitata]
MAFTPPPLRPPVPPAGEQARFLAEAGTRMLDRGGGGGGARGPAPQSPVLPPRPHDELLDAAPLDLAVPPPVAEGEEASPKREGRAAPAPIDPFHLAKAGPPR